MESESSDPALIVASAPVRSRGNGAASSQLLLQVQSLCNNILRLVVQNGNSLNAVAATSQSSQGQRGDPSVLQMRLTRHLRGHDPQMRAWPHQIRPNQTSIGERCSQLQ